MVDRPPKGSKALVYVPRGFISSHYDAIQWMKSIIGSRAKVKSERWGSNPLGEFTHLKVEFARIYTQSVVAVLRTLPECESVRLRVAYVMRDEKNPHCTPQCEGAWVLDEKKGISHEDSCQCWCGGLKHNTGNPWWRRWESVYCEKDDQVEIGSRDSGIILYDLTHDIRVLQSLEASSKVKVTNLHMLKSRFA